MLPQKFNDSIALLVVVGVPALWVATKLPEAVLGATITAWALVLNYYFRKAEPKP